jgi:hypothetical protein
MRATCDTVGIAGRKSRAWISPETHLRRKSTLEVFGPTARWPYSAEAARNPAMSMMRAAANQRRSVGMAKIMGHTRLPD